MTKSSIKEFIVEAIFYVVAKLVQIFLSVISVAMFLRVILQFFASEDNKLVLFCYGITEPFIIPVRVLLEKMNVGQDSPLDIPFFVTYLILAVLQMILPII